MIELQLNLIFKLDENKALDLKLDHFQMYEVKEYYKCKTTTDEYRAVKLLLQEAYYTIVNNLDKNYLKEDDAE